MAKPTSLLSLIVRDHMAPPRLLVYGTEGIGKSTFAAGAPKPIFIQTEDGLGGITVDAFPKCKTYDEFKAQVASLVKEKHDFKTVVIDSADWLDTLIAKDVCNTAGVTAIAEIPYGKGTGIVEAEWSNVLNSLNVLRDNGMFVIFTAHGQIKKGKDVEKGDFDIETIKMPDKSRAKLLEWTDIIGLACWQLILTKKDGGFKDEFMAKSTGERLFRTKGSVSYTAKSRYPLPPELPLQWETFHAALKAGARTLKETKPAKEA